MSGSYVLPSTQQANADFEFDPSATVVQQCCGKFTWANLNTSLCLCFLCESE